MSLTDIQYRLRGRGANIVCIVFLLIVFLVVGLFAGSVSLSFSQTGSAVVINEIMYNPTQNENYNEWVEIRNISDSPIELSEWKICDQKILAGYVDHADGQVKGDNGTVFSAGKYAVVTDGGASGTDAYSNFSVARDSLAVHVDAASICGSLENSAGSEKEIVLSNGVENEKVKYFISWGGDGNGKTIGLINGIWKETEPTPGGENKISQNSETLAAPQPALTFSSPSITVAGKEFSVSVSLANFGSGTYALKILVGKNGDFIFGNTKGSSGWLSQNGAWKDMPQITIGSGEGTKIVKARVDNDASSGSYRIAVSVAEKKSNGSYSSLWTTEELEKKSLVVSDAPVVASSSESDGSPDSGASGEPTTYSNEAVGNPIGEVLGEESNQEEEFQLNFYIIVGVFGLIVGSGGLVLGFRYRRNNSVAAR